MFPFTQSYDNLEQRRQLQQQRLRHRLQLQSDQIERVLDAHRLPAQVSGGMVVSEVVEFDLQAQFSHSWERLRALTTDLRQALGVPQISISRENGRLQVAVAKQVDAPVRLLDLMAMGKMVGRETAVLGLSDEGQPVFLPLQNGHILISGVNRAGKTSILRSISMSLALSNRQSQLQQIIIAPIFENNNAYAALEPLTLLPHMSAQIAYTVEDAIQILTWLAEDMENRLRWQETTPAIVLMIDQVVQLIDLGDESVLDALTLLLQRGPRAGIHLILTTSQPEADLLDTHLKANLPVRIAGQAADTVQAVAATGREYSEADCLLGQGDFLLVQDDEMHYFQAAYIGDYDLHLSLKKLQQSYKYSLVAQPFLIRPDLKEPEADPIPASFWMRDGSVNFFGEEK